MCYLEIQRHFLLKVNVKIRAEWLISFFEFYIKLLKIKIMSFKPISSLEKKEERWRYIHIQGSNSISMKGYAKNKIVTSRYTLLNFIPLNIRDQFRSYAYYIFLIDPIAQIFLDPYSSFSWMFMIPFLLLLFTTFIFDAIQDIKHHRNDSATNNKEYDIWDGYKFSNKKLEDIEVGDIILLKINEIAPADILVLYVSENDKICYIDATKAIGGTDIIIKKPVRETQLNFDTNDIDESKRMTKLDIEEIAAQIPKLNAKIKVPESSQGEFYGSIKLSTCPNQTEIDIYNLIQLGSQLIETSWIFGVVVYTGTEASTIGGLSCKPKKLSTLEKKLNRWVFWMTLLLFGMVLSGFFVSIYSYGLDYDDTYMSLFLNLLILDRKHIPVMLYVTLPVIRFFQSWKISKKYEGICVRSSKASEDLGQVEIILADRAGTISKNKLKITACCIGETVYEWTDTIQTEIPETCTPKEQDKNNEITCINPTNEKLSFKSLKNDFIKGINDESPVYNFVMCMAICNQVFPKSTEKMIYMSADDRILMDTSKDLGVSLLSKAHDTCLVDILGNIIEFPIIAFHHYTGDSRKYRIIVGSHKTGEAILYVKGPKSKMFDIYNLTDEEKLNVEENLFNYNQWGKRHIFMGYKKLAKDEMDSFNFAYNNAKLSPINRDGRIEHILEELEQGISYLGCVTIEDQISNGTKNAISLLSEGGIKFWLMSGEDEEITLTTAVAAEIFEIESNIARIGGYNSQLDCAIDMINHVKNHILHCNTEKTAISNQIAVSGTFLNCDIKKMPNSKTDPVLLDGDESPQSFFQYGRRRSQEYMKTKKFHPFLTQIASFSISSPLKMSFNPDSVYFVLSIDSNGIDYALSSEENRKIFCSLLCAAHSVCFHSLKPNDKTRIASLLRYNFSYKPIFLAIGDSSSDAGMINSAHVGVEITGSKGLCSLNSGHYAIKKFSLLKNLVLIEGHWNYVRTSNIVMMILFKSAFYSFLAFFYSLIKSTAANSIFESWLLSMYNLVITGIPLIIIGIFDVDIDENRIFTYPEVYRAGLYRLLLTTKKLFYVFAKALAYSLICFFIIMNIGIWNDSGFTENFDLNSTILYLCMCFSFLLYMIIESYSYSKFTILAYVFFIISAIIILELTSWTIVFEKFGILQMINISPMGILLIIFVTLITAIFNYALKTYSILFFPSFVDFLRNNFKGKAYYEDQTRVSYFNERLDEVYKESKDYRKKNHHDMFKINKWILRFASELTESEYQTEKFDEKIKSYRILIMIQFISCFIFNLYIWAADIGSISFQIYYTIYKFVYFACIFISWLPYFKGNLKQLIFALNVYEGVAFLITTFAFKVYLHALYYSWPPLILIGLCNDWAFSLILTFIMCIFVSTSAIIEISLIDDLSSSEVILHSFEFVTVYFSIWLTSAFIGYFTEKYNRNKFILIKKVEIEVEKSKQVLECVLPNFVRKRVKDGARYIADDQGIVTVLFCDIYNFEDIIEGYSPQELTAFLDNVYRKFDHLCEMVGVVKIETVGKTYMACAGIKDCEAELDPHFQSVSHARRAIEMGISILKSIQKIKLWNGETLKVKIGIHSGPVTAGVVGFHKPQFSLVGDTVNTASRMASTIKEPNIIQISEETYALVDSKSDLIFTQTRVEAKGKGWIETLLVKERKIHDTGVEIPAKEGLQLPLIHSRTFARKKVSSGEIRRNSEVNRKSIIMLQLDINDPSQLFARKNTEIIDPVKLISCSCKENKKEMLLRIQMIENKFSILYPGLLIGAVSNAFLGAFKIVYIILNEGNDDANIISSVFLFIVSFIFIGIIISTKKCYKSKAFPWFIKQTCFFIICAVIIEGFTENNELDSVEISYVIYNALLIVLCSGLFMKYLVITSLMMLGVVVPLIIIDHTMDTCLHLIAFGGFIVVINCIGYTVESDLRVFFALKDLAKKELEKTENLLTQMMPPHVYKRLKEEITTTDSLPQVTLLYADIVGFTAWSSNRSPDSIVGMLYELFSEFDKKCVENHVYKVHTIGDCYVAMSFKGDLDRNPGEECLNIIKFASSMIEVIDAMNQEHGSGLNMRIGIHTGNIIGGITGTNIVRYDIYGKDVLIANQIESNGLAGRVSVSEATKNLIENYSPGLFGFSSYKAIDISSIKTKIQTFLIDIE
ncbi:unnamed protein product [Blepharisma stoltei]|uniref:Guanylate cyclase domain-containing protein n=1 Tax=Blepharisma stoltei TaxID=1481888 RepID=A0AAU9JAJ9_9CILI|nr:unnamed protein product [Blepharisma stoltei]